MNISVLDRNDEALQATLGGLHDAAEWIDDELLPCRINDPELFFAESPTDVEYAKALCTDCPVQAMCLVGALERREPWGVWGGELFLQGVVIPRKRPRGRPRKNPVEAA
jgi:WhiB family redox-sensing transcriptional regulator